MWTKQDCDFSDLPFLSPISFRTKPIVTPGLYGYICTKKGKEGREEKLQSQWSRSYRVTWFLLTLTRLGTGILNRNGAPVEELKYSQFPCSSWVSRKVEATKSPAVFNLWQSSDMINLASAPSRLMRDFIYFIWVLCTFSPHEIVTPSC